MKEQSEIFLVNNILSIISFWNSNFWNSFWNCFRKLILEFSLEFFRDFIWNYFWNFLIILFGILFGNLLKILSDFNFCAAGVCGSAGVGKEKFDLMTGVGLPLKNWAILQKFQLLNDKIGVLVYSSKNNGSLVNLLGFLFVSVSLVREKFEEMREFIFHKIQTYALFLSVHPPICMCNFRCRRLELRLDLSWEKTTLDSRGKT